MTLFALLAAVVFGTVAKDNDRARLFYGLRFLQSS